MANKFFKFKQFTVFHDRCAMKVGTDGVLLGAWANFDNCQSVLDVGTGSGLIALMAAQRNLFANIMAIEIDAQATLQAKENIKNSPFREKIEVLGISFRDFASSTTQKFDVIVSNPPFFVDSLPSPDSKRTDARHADSLSVSELFELSRKLLNETGKLSVIYPFSERVNIISVAEKENYYLSRETIVFPTPSALPKRILMEFSVKRTGEIDRSELTIEEKRHVYTPEFCQLTKDFYLYL